MIDTLGVCEPSSPIYQRSIRSHYNSITQYVAVVGYDVGPDNMNNIGKHCVQQVPLPSPSVMTYDRNTNRWCIYLEPAIRRTSILLFDVNRIMTTIMQHQDSETSSYRVGNAFTIIRFYYYRKSKSLGSGTRSSVCTQILEDVVVLDEVRQCPVGGRRKVILGDDGRQISIHSF